jgi:very-short-patch-repair endonuclease
MEFSPSLARILRSQDGVISRRQATEAGLSRDQVRCRVQRGEWLRVHPGIYRLSAAIPSAEATLRAASLWVADRGLLSGAGAAWWWEMVPEPPSSWQFLTGQRYALEPGAGISVRRCFVDPNDAAMWRGVALVDRPLAALQTAVALEQERPGQGIALIDRAKQKRCVHQRELQSAYDRHRGTAGSPAMKLLLDRTGDRAHSQLERAGVRELRAAGLADFVLNHRTVLASGRSVELDVAFVEQRVGLEFDGYAYHSSADQHRSDLQRANEIMASGWVLRRFTWSDVLADPDGFVRTVRAALEAQM